MLRLVGLNFMETFVDILLRVVANRHLNRSGNETADHSNTFEPKTFQFNVNVHVPTILQN